MCKKSEDTSNPFNSDISRQQIGITSEIFTNALFLHPILDQWKGLITYMIYTNQFILYCGLLQVNRTKLKHSRYKHKEYHALKM